MMTPKWSSSRRPSPHLNNKIASTPRFSAGARNRRVFYDAKVMVLAINTTAPDFCEGNGCGSHTVTTKDLRRAWLALAVMFVVVLRSSLICHTPVISSDMAIDALILSSYCSVSGKTPAPPPGEENDDDRVTCLHSATRRRITVSSAGESV